MPLVIDKGFLVFGHSAMYASVSFYIIYLRRSHMHKKFINSTLPTERVDGLMIIMMRFGRRFHCFCITINFGFAGEGDNTIVTFSGAFTSVVRPINYEPEPPCKYIKRSNQFNVVALLHF